MTITQIPQRIEIAFWVMVIPIMKDSSVAGDAITRAYILMESLRKLKVWQQLMLLAITGLLVGFVIGLIKAGG